MISSGEGSPFCRVDLVKLRRVASRIIAPAKRRIQPERLETIWCWVFEGDMRFRRLPEPNQKKFQVVMGFRAAFRRIR